MEHKISASCKQLQEIVGEFCQQQEEGLTRLAAQVSALFASGGQLVLAGSAAFQPIVQLLAGHFTYRLGFDRPVLPAVALGSDGMLMSLMGNNRQYDQHLVRHYRSLNSENQLLLLLNDGTAAAPLRALRDELLENELPVAMISVAGSDDPLCRDGVDPCISLSTDSPARQLELALFAGQLLCELVEAELFGV